MITIIIIILIIIILIIIIISCDVVSKQTNKDSFYVTICSLFWGPVTDKVYTLQFRENSFLFSVYLHIEMQLSPKHAWLLPVFPSVGTTCTPQMYRTLTQSLLVDEYFRKFSKLCCISGWSTNKKQREKNDQRSILYTKPYNHKKAIFYPTFMA